MLLLERNAFCECGHLKSVHTFICFIPWGRQWLGCEKCNCSKFKEETANDRTGQYARAV